MSPPCTGQHLRKARANRRRFRTCRRLPEVQTLLSLHEVPFATGSLRTASTMQLSAVQLLLSSVGATAQLLPDAAHTFVAPHRILRTHLFIRSTTTMPPSAVTATPLGAENCAGFVGSALKPAVRFRQKSASAARAFGARHDCLGR